MKEFRHAFDFGPRLNQIYLHQIGCYTRTLLQDTAESISQDANDDVLLEGLSIAIINLITYITALHGEMGGYTAGSIREGDDDSTGWASLNTNSRTIATTPPQLHPHRTNLPPLVGCRDAEMRQYYATVKSEQQQNDLRALSWLPQEILSITPGVTSFTLAKGDAGFEIRVAAETDVVRCADDVSFGVDGHGTRRRSQKLDPAFNWSRQKAAERIAGLQADVSAELPPAPPLQFPVDHSALDVYGHGGFTLRLSRVGNLVSLGVSREKNGLERLRVLSPA